MQDYWCETTVDVTKTRFQWTLNNIKYYDPHKDIKSPQFSDNSNRSIKWFLIFVKNFEREPLREPKLKIESQSLSNKSMFRYVIVIKNEQGQQKKFSDISAISTPVGRIGWENIDKYSSNVIMSINNFDMTNKLVIDCEIGIIHEMHNTSGNYERIEPIFDSTFAADVLNRLLEDQIASDVVLIIGQQEFRAHKAILMARSEYFKAMFENSMTESQTNRVEIKDFDQNVIEILLRFLYTGRVTQLSDDVCPQLLIAADKYQLNDLKSICSQYLYSNMNNNNAIQALQLADTLNAPKLKNRSLHYIKNNVKELIKTNEWKEFIKTNELLGEILMLSL